MTYDWKFYDQSNTDQTATKKAPYTGGTVSADCLGCAVVGERTRHRGQLNLLFGYLV